MNFQVRVTVLSPLHIGTGSILLRGYDFVTSGERTWVLDQAAILAAEYDAHAGVVDWRRLGRPPGELVQAADLREGSACVRYSLTGTMTVDQVREQIKDPFGRCYLPGSSLKGALRSALFSHAVRSGAYRPDVRRLGERREWAGQPWEREVFGRDPNHDLLRALVVADSDPLPTAPSPLMLLNAQVFAAGPPGSPIVVEAIRQDTVLETTLRLDEYLFSPHAQELGFGERREWLERLPEVVNDYSRARIEAERKFLAGRRDLAATARFYQELAARLLPTGACLLQMAWGAGWSGKSVGPWLPREMQDHIRRRYRLGRPPRFRGDWQPDLSKPFPKSRRLRSRRVQGQIVADVPLGWVLVEMTEVGQ
jgi:CRISPR-associated protein Csm5